MTWTFSKPQFFRLYMFNNINNNNKFHVHGLENVTGLNDQHKMNNDSNNM